VGALRVSVGEMEIFSAGEIFIPHLPQKLVSAGFL
jgi:hypothetical protein